MDKSQSSVPVRSRMTTPGAHPDLLLVKAPRQVRISILVLLKEP